jgi:Histidine kinase
MTSFTVSRTKTLTWRSLFSAQRVLTVAIITLVYGLLLSLGWQSGLPALMARVFPIGFVALTVYGLAEVWPKQLPSWCARWALQIPCTVFAIYVYSTTPGAPPFWRDNLRFIGFLSLTVTGVLLAPWIALAALVRQREALVRDLELAFELERSELERQASDARLHLLQAQVAPHFLFNTLANIQALVETNSPKAPGVLRSLIAYLRAAVPRLQGNQVATFAEELALVRAYLELMHMRMPDRLQFAIHADPAALAFDCPPVSLLTLVENAVRHGIDPCEDGGRIDIMLQLNSITKRCQARVTDTGMGLQSARAGLGTGLQTLQERLRLNFGQSAVLVLREHQPRGMVAEIDIPARHTRTPFEKFPLQVAQDRVDRA